jgi:hypothetical protein
MRTLAPSNVKAVDLDGTLANDAVISMTDYRSDVIGNPIQQMVNRVKAWLDRGDKVVIFTARVHPKHGLAEVAIAEKAIKEWCLKVFGIELEVTCMKDPMFNEIWDDKGVRVVQDTGEVSSQQDVDDPLVHSDTDAIGSFFDL